ncbi:MAG: hypothetical protein ACAH11_15755 [Sphingomonas sp.]
MTDERVTWGLISKIRAKPRWRDALAVTLTEFYAAHTAPYATVVVAEDAADKDVVWVTQFWESEAVHATIMVPDLLDAYGKSAALIERHEIEIVIRPVMEPVTV